MKKKFEVFVTCFLVFISGMGAGYAWRMVHEIHEPISYEYPVMTQEEKEEFCRVLRKHGLLEGSVIYEDVLGYYFIRDGKRCPFKG